MYIGIDATCWWNRRGFGRFTRELLTAMFASGTEHKFCLFIDRQPEPEMNHAQVRTVRVQVQRSVTESAVADGRRSLGDIWAFRRATAAEPIDVLFFPAVYSWFPPGGRCATAVTLHDAIAEHFPYLVFPGWKARLFWSLKVRLACIHAKRIITVSNAAKNEIIEYIGLRPENIDVICEGADARFRPIVDEKLRLSARRRAGLPPDVRLLLYVGGLAPHKNLSNLLAAFSRIAQRADMDDLHLALVGDPRGDGFHSNYEALVDRVSSSENLRGRVHFTGFIPDEDLPALYSDSLATVLPSVSEGFGLPALEAMACGTPVLTSNIGAAPEVVDTAGLTFNPYHPEEIAQQIYRIASEPSTLAELRSNALDRAQRYSWQEAAKMTLSSLESCAGAR